jgi:hypothetical protein
MHSVITVTMEMRMRWSEHVARMEEMRNVHRILVGKGIRPLGIPRRRCKDNIKMVFKRTVCEDIDRILLAKNRVYKRALVKTVMDLRVP